MAYLGYHIPSAVGYQNMVQCARDAGADTFAFYTRATTKYDSFALTYDDAVEMGKQLAARATGGESAAPAFGPLVVHAAYSMNLSYPDPAVRSRVRDFFRREMSYLESLPFCYYNIHAGQHGGQGPDQAIGYIAEALNEILQEDLSTMILLETLPGKGSEIGGSFEELAAILERLVDPGKVGICLDTCHLWDGGYDVAGDPQGVLDEADRILGLDTVRAIHLNDSFYDRGAHMDRHERVGKGLIGEDALRYILTHPAFSQASFILETPGDAESHRREIALLRSWLQEDASESL